MPSGMSKLHPVYLILLHIIQTRTFNCIRTYNQTLSQIFETQNVQNLFEKQNAASCAATFDLITKSNVIWWNSIFLFRDKSQSFVRWKLIVSHGVARVWPLHDTLATRDTILLQFLTNKWPITFILSHLGWDNTIVLF